MRPSRLGLLLVLAVAAALRFWALGHGIPYGVSVDEPEIVERALRMMKAGTLNPHFFDYGQLTIYIQLVVSIVRFIVQGGPVGTSAGDIQDHVDLPASTLSHHLKRLSSAGLVRSRNDGTFIFYSADFDALRQLTAYIWEDCCKRGKGTC